MAKTRSPNYPVISLAEALDRVKKIYKAEHLHSASDEVIAKALNYTSLNGRSMGVISAIKKYGLLVPEGDGYKVSDEAVNIIELPPDDPDHIKALKTAAFTPQLFAELHETYGTQLPSDSNLRHFLIKKKFNPNAADEVIKLYRDTMGLVTGLTSEYDSGGSDDKDKLEDKPPMQQPPPTGATPISQPRPQRPPGMLSMDAQREIAQSSAYGTMHSLLHQPAPTSEGLNFQVSENSINVTFNGTVTQEIIRKLIKHLEINIEDFPTKAEVEQQRQANLIKNFTTNPQTGKPYTEGMSQDQVENIVDMFVKAGKPPDSE